VSKGLNPRKQNNNGLEDSWGKISFFAKEKPPSSFEQLRSSLKGGSMRGYRDTGTSLASTSRGSDETTFSFSPRRLVSSSSSRGKSFRKGNRNHRKKVSTALQSDLMSSIRNSPTKYVYELNQKRRKGQQRKKFRKTKFYKNLMRKAK